MGTNLATLLTDTAERHGDRIALKVYEAEVSYGNRPEATKEATVDGWFHTGDLAYVDEDGFYFVVDRKKDMIIRGGYNVYPREIEEVLYEHEAVAECAVLGVPDEQMGEEVGAAVVLKSGQDVSEDDLREFAKDQMAAYKYPRRIWFPEELPKGPTGKILKKDVKVPETVKTS